MPHLLGLQVHSDGLTVAAMRPDQTIVLRPVDDLASVLRRTSARRWKWSLGVEDRAEDAADCAHELFSALQHAMGDDSTLVGLAVPAVWSDRQRRALLQSMEDTTLEVIGLARNTTALAIGAAHHDPSVGGLCALLHLGTHGLEFAIVEVSPGRVLVRARKSVVGLDGANVKAEGIVSLIAAVARFTARQAGASTTDLTRLLCAGRRAQEPALRRDLHGAWGVPVEACPRGAIAVGAALVAVGLSGVGRPWELLDDLGEPPLASLRGTPGPRSTRPPPPPPMVEEPPPVEDFDDPPIDEVLVIERYRTSAPPPPPVAVEEPVLAVEEPRPSAAPTPSSSPAAEPPPAGAFVGLRSLDDVRALRLQHPVGPDALARPSLAALLRQFTSLRGSSGTLVLRRPGERVAIPIERGDPCLTPAEQAAVRTAFGWPDGTFTWQRERVPWVVRSRSAPMDALVAAGLRARLDALDEADLARALASLLALAPSVRDPSRALLGAMALTADEQRLVDRFLDGADTLGAALRRVDAPRAPLCRLVALLDAYAALRWAEPGAAPPPD